MAQAVFILLDYVYKKLFCFVSAFLYAHRLGAYVREMRILCI